MKNIEDRRASIDNRQQKCLNHLREFEPQKERREVNNLSIRKIQYLKTQNCH